MTLTIEWWHIPATITALFVCWFAVRDSEPLFGDLFFVIVATVVSLCAWLIAALLRVMV